MEIALFKSTCLICWKSFEVPVLPDADYGSLLFYDKSKPEFGYFNWIDNPCKEQFINSFILTDPDFKPEYQTKGNAAAKIIALIADGNWKLSSNRFRCPRCKLKFNYISNYRTQMKNIAVLQFKKFDSLNDEEKIEFIKNLTKDL